MSTWPISKDLSRRWPTDYHEPGSILLSPIESLVPMGCLRLDNRLQLRGASDLRRARLAGFLDQADALCTGKGDGAVTIASARLPGADSQRMFDLTHIELLQVPDKKPESAPVVQWILETLRSQK